MVLGFGLYEKASSNEGAFSYLAITLATSFFARPLVGKVPIGRLRG